jgi:hypothetical protein
VGKSNDRDTSIKDHSAILRRMNTIDDVLDKRNFWFFQLRESFLRQERLAKWDFNRLDEYILLPINYGFVNNEDCYFVSHYWREPDNPDPDGVDLRLFIEDLADAKWSYIWVDWTCIPQGDNGCRTDRENRYFKMMLQCIPMLIRDCAFEWRFPPFEPRAWILYEVAEYVLTHRQSIEMDDSKPFIDHVLDMVRLDVDSVLKKHKYKCTNDSDMYLVTGWLEILVIMAKVFPTDIGSRQVILDSLNRPYAGTYWNPLLDLEIDKARGVVRHKGSVYNFTPIFHITSYISSSEWHGGPRNKSTKE